MQKPKKEGKFAVWVEDPETGEGRLSAEAFGLTVSVYDEGTFENDKGEMQAFPAGIKLNNGKLNIKVTALQAIMLTKFLADEPVRDVIKTRSVAEKEIYDKNMKAALEY
jgi:hypothetical protein